MDLDRIKYVKNYIYKMANGTNPITDTPVADDEIINNIDISRCLFYVNDLLQKIIDNGGITNKKTKKERFYITASSLKLFEYSKTPITISEITSRINSINQNQYMKNLKSTNITDWLLDINILETVQLNDHHHRRPTDSGNSIGISVEERFGKNGTYYVNLYNESAQHFIIDNFDAVLSYVK